MHEYLRDKMDGLRLLRDFRLDFEGFTESDFAKLSATCRKSLHNMLTLRDLYKQTDISTRTPIYRQLFNVLNKEVKPWPDSVT